MNSLSLRHKLRIRPRQCGLVAAVALLSGCHMVVLDPAGDVAAQQRDLVVISTVLMLLIIIPVMALTVFFAWKYRQSNTAARYEPEWSHSTQLELVIWAAPLLIIICMGALTWMGTHILDPYREVARINPHQPMEAKIKPIQVDVVALDWKWLFIYPELGIATVNEAAAPVDRPIDFRITSDTVMNSFYVPALAGQIYAMPGMETKLHAVINKPGDYEGFSANYSGAGFSGMRFRFYGQTEAQFAAWVAQAKRGGKALNREQYLQLEHPSEDVPVRQYATVTPGLYHDVVNMCVSPGKMCADDMMRIDAQGGAGLAGVANVLPLNYDKYAARGTNGAVSQKNVAGGLHTPPDVHDKAAAVMTAPGAAADAEALAGAGLIPPGIFRHPASSPAG